MKNKVPLKDKVREDILAIEKKKQIFYEVYPVTYQEIAKKHKISMQYVFKIRKEMKDLKTYPRISGK